MTVLLAQPSETALPESGWAALEAELDIWQSAGRVASFWWRDDDAVTDTPALDRLLAIAEDVPLGLAAIPAKVETALARRVVHVPSVAVLQHGWRHVNHAGPGARKSEFGAERPLAERLEDLRLGHARLRSVFGGKALSVLVPPWNRIGADLVPRLPEIGIGGLSVTDSREAATPTAGVTMVPVQADLVDWRGSRGFIGEAKALGLMLGHLRRRFLGTLDADGPTGILTHHLVQDPDTERFLRRFLSIARRHPAAAFVPISALFPEP